MKKAKAEKEENILGIDFGLRNIGLAFSRGFLAESFATLKVKSSLEAVNKIRRIIEEEKIKRVVIGISERKMAQKTKVFARDLKKLVNLPIVFCDETLTSKEARKKMYQAGKAKRKRKIQEHQVAACLILQEYLDTLKDSSF